eukprot:g3096.t1
MGNCSVRIHSDGHDISTSLMLEKKSSFNVARTAKKRSRWIDKLLRSSHELENKTVKMILLGAGNTGKSTIIKQLTILNSVNRDLPSSTYRFYRDLIPSNIINAFQILISLTKSIEEITGKIHDSLYECQFKVQTMYPEEKWWEVGEEKSRFEPTCTRSSNPSSHNGGMDLREALPKLWRDPAIQRAYRNRFRVTFEYALGYFMRDDVFQRVIQSDYEPSQTDILRARYRTRGVSKFAFNLEKMSYVVLDVGGQRNERRKWLCHFDNCKAVIYVASLAEYDCTLMEDVKVNRMKEDLTLFNFICQCPYFRKSSILLFLNKVRPDLNLFSISLSISTVLTLQMYF